MGVMASRRGLALYPSMGTFYLHNGQSNLLLLFFLILSPLYFIVDALFKFIIVLISVASVSKSVCSLLFSNPKFMVGK